MKRYELTPNDSHKSFYGKCYVEEYEDGTKVLYSYHTKIMTEKSNGEYVRHWRSWSATTGRHIKAFCGLNKAEYLALPLEE